MISTREKHCYRPARFSLTSIAITFFVVAASNMQNI